jgi:hypothetical protein
MEGKVRVRFHHHAAAGLLHLLDLGLDPDPSQNRRPFPLKCLLCVATCCRRRFTGYPMKEGTQTQNAEKLCTFFPLWLCTSPGLAHLFLLVCSGNFLRCTCTLTGRGTAYVAAYPIYFVFDISETRWACLPLPVLRAPTAAAFHKPSQAMKSAHSV